MCGSTLAAMSTGLRASVVFFIAWTAGSLPAWAQPRFVVVNGQRLSDGQIAQLEQRACTGIPNGQYWLNMQNGAWGYAGSARVQGVLGDQCTQQRRRSLSERRELYRPGEILSQ